MLSIKSIKDLEGKRVLVRVDFNVPIENGKVLDSSRIAAALPTIQYLIEKKAKIILMTHLGRPNGEVVEELRVEPVANRLSELLGVQVLRCSKVQDSKTKELISEMKNGDVALLENIRFSSDEKNNTGTLAKDLASLADIFVLDGFAVAHRATASVVGVAEYLPSYAGLLLHREIEGLDKALENPKKPFVVILGGAKVATKVPVIKQLLSISDHILIGGGIVNTYLKAKGYGIASSIFDEGSEDEAFKYCEKEHVITPVDVVVGLKDGSSSRVVEIKKNPHEICTGEEAIFDIGPKTLELFKKYIEEANTLIWNGAMGYFEQKPYDVGTLEIARLIAERSRSGAYSVIGGGETLQSMNMVGLLDDIDLVSTGGGAMLEYLSGKELLGITAILKK